MRALRKLLFLGVAVSGLGGCVVYPDGTFGPVPVFVPGPVFMPPPVYMPPPVILVPRPFHRPYWGPRRHHFRRW